MMHAKFQDNRTSGSGEEGFGRFFFTYRQSLIAITKHQSIFKKKVYLPNVNNDVTTSKYRF